MPRLVPGNGLKTGLNESVSRPQSLARVEVRVDRYKQLVHWVLFVVLTE